MAAKLPAVVLDPIAPPRLVTPAGLLGVEPEAGLVIVVPEPLVPVPPSVPGGCCVVPRVGPVTVVPEEVPVPTVPGGLVPKVP